MGGKEKMFKKITTILLSITLFLTLCPAMGVFAATTNQMENFDVAAAGDYKTFDSLGLTNTMLSTESNEPVFKIVEGAGADGKTTKMLEMKSPTTADAVLKFPAFDYTAGAGTEYSISFDFYFEKLPTAATEFTTSTGLFMRMLRDPIGYYSHSTAGVATAGKMTLSSNSGSTSVSNNVSEKKWYRAELYIKDLVEGETYNSSGTVTTVASNKGGGYIVRALYDMSDKALNSTNLKTDSRQYNKTQPINDLFVLDLKPVTTDGNGFKVRIDDVEIRSFNPSTDGPTVRESAIEKNSTISAETTQATIVFDQELSDTSVKLTSGGTELNTPTLTKVSNTMTTATYTLSGLNLEKGKDYKLDFSGCTNESGTRSPETISFKTQSGTEMIKLTDDFETDLIDSNKSGYKGYNTSNSESSPLYSGSRSADSGTISRVAGYKGGNALQLATSGVNTYTGSHISALNTSDLYTPAFNSDTNQYEQFVLTYRFRIDKAADYNTTFMLDGEEYTTEGTNINFYSHNVHNLDYDRVIARITNSGDKLVIKPGRHATWELNSYYQPEIAINKWYNIVWVVDGVNQTFNLIDTETGKMTFTCSAELAIPEGGHKFNIFNGNWARSTTDKTISNQNQTVLIDDFTLWQIKPWETAQKLDLASETTVSDNKVTFNFNQPVLTKMNMLNVTKGSYEKAYSIPTITYKDFCTSEISFSNFVAGQSYTVDYSATKGVSGAGFIDDDNKIEFTIATPSEAVSLNVEATGAKVGDTVTFDFWAEETGEATFLAAFYDNAVEKELVGVEIAKRNVVAGKNTITITLENDYSAKAQEVEIFTWNNLTDLKPLTESVKLPCSDTLKVLMIGNSLSEDANRHLNNVAALGGLELDLTVAGIGGSGLPIHAANLKAELAGRTKQDALDLINEMKEEDSNASTPFLYWIYDNGVCRSTSYIYRERLLDMLTAKDYDVISLQQYDNYEDSEFSETLPYLAEQIRKLQPDAELVLYQTWSESYKARESRSLLFDTIKAPANEKWAALTPQLVSGITEGNAPMRIIPAGTAFYVADEMYEIFGEKLPGTEGNTNEGVQDQNEYEFSVASSLWRDKNHASFYGCYLADAVWFECLTGRKAPIGTVAAPAVPCPTEADITAEQHIERLGYLSDVAHSVVMARR